ncbi:MAG TPA: BatA domain-containing protein, partial [Fibrobacteria bacterium]|nr:BatA domain-containing protein [Fibrobacteria bacterium]
MFSFLTPFSPWLGALLAIPLVIHFLGRQRLRKEPFPSLMLLEERFAKSMQRHRLKNLLLLFLRTLLILCLFLALANPSLERTGGGGSKVESAAAIVH